MKIECNGISAEYVDHMGSDLSVVNAARVSFNKTKEVMDASDEKLIDYLVKHNHWSPLAHTAISLRVQAPIFLARQLGKHQVGLVWNEVSRRYVDDEPEFFYPQSWRGRPVNAKQGSSDTVIDDPVVDAGYEHIVRYATQVYEGMLSVGVAPEQARMVLPQSMMTTWIWTGSLVAFARVYGLRSDSHAQKEAREFADMLSDVIEPLYPLSWKALTSSE